MQQGDWMLLEHDPLSFKTIYMRVVGDKIQIRETIPMWLATQILEENKARAKAFDEAGGWKNPTYRRNGCLVASIPDHLDAHFKVMSGFDPIKGGQYDKDKYNSFLDDSDYRHLRTGGGKMGKRKAFV